MGLNAVLYCIALHFIALHRIAVYCIPLHCIVLALDWIGLHCVALLPIAFHHITSPYHIISYNGTCLLRLRTPCQKRKNQNVPGSILNKNHVYFPKMGVYVTFVFSVDIEGPIRALYGVISSLSSQGTRNLPHPINCSDSHKAKKIFCLQ